MFSVDLKVKQTLWSKILFKILVYLVRFRITIPEKLTAVINYSLQKGAFKYKIGNGKWKPLEMPEINLEE